MYTVRTFVIGAFFVGVLSGCTSDNLLSSSDAPSLTSRSPKAGKQVEAVSLFGEPLERPPMSTAIQRTRQAQLDEAASNLSLDPNDETAAIWYGRRLAYLGRYNDAVETFTNALAVHPESYRLRRHRGHRYITLRRFDDAIADLERADGLMRLMPDETEEDGQPNAMGIPRSSTRTNILYHLGLAHYLKGDFNSSYKVFSRCLSAARNDDNRVSSAYWLVLSQLRSGRRDESVSTMASISRDMNVIENHAYHRLLLMFKGEMLASEITPAHQGDSVQDATVAYGVAAWLLINGDQADATRRLRAIMDAGTWPAFGHIAAEAELARAE